MNWFKNLRTVTKLMVGFGLMALCMAFVGYQGISVAKTYDNTVDNLYGREMMGALTIKEAGMHKVEIARDTRSAMIATDKAGAEKKALAVDNDFAEFKEDFFNAEKILDTAEAKAEIAKIKELLPTYESKEKEVVGMVVAGKSKEAVAGLENVQAVSEEISRSLEKIIRMEEQRGKQAYDESQALYERVRKELIAIVCLATLISLGFGYFIARLISKPLGAAVSVLGKVADGDLTAKLEVHTKDEVGQMATALNAATSAMRNALTEVRKSAESMASSAQELASASEELASGAQEQASSLEETTATLEQITSTVKQNADNANQASQVASASRESAEKGGQVVSGAVAAMGEINQSSKSIAEIITTIDEIAFQTNLLALNAAVEAARAGEQGRGFAVVATEVRNLAQRSATSAKEIKRLIQDSVRKVENGSGLVNKSGETLHEIVGSVKRVTDIVAEIAAASREQSTGVEQVNKAMMQMDQVTQTNSSQTEELSATAQNLSAHAQQLQSLVERFRLDTGDSRRSPAAPAQEMAATTAAVHAAQVAPRHRARAAVAAGMKTSPVAKPKPNGHDSAELNAFTEF